MGRDNNSTSFRLLGSNTNCQIIGSKPSICGTAGSTFSNVANDNVDPENLISPDYRSESLSYHLKDGQELDDKFGDHAKVDALIKEDKFQLFAAGVGIDNTLFAGRFTGIDINDATTYRDLEFELSILSLVQGCAFTYSNKLWYTVDKLPTTMF